jgi:hypothetical protein
MKKLATALVAAGALFALSGCVADPYYGNSYYGAGYYGGSGYGYYGSSRPYNYRYDRPYRGRYYDRRNYRRDYRRY